MAKKKKSRKQSAKKSPKKPAKKHRKKSRKRTVERPTKRLTGRATPRIARESFREVVAAALTQVQYDLQIKVDEANENRFLLEDVFVDERVVPGLAGTYDGSTGPLDIPRDFFQPIPELPPKTVTIRVRVNGQPPPVGVTLSAHSRPANGVWCDWQQLGTGGDGQAGPFNVSGQFDIRRCQKVGA